MNNERINDSLKALAQAVTELKTQVRKDKLFEVWVDEATAAAALGYSTRRFRRKVKAGEINIDFRCTNGRKFQYSRKGILAFQNSTSTIV